MSARIESLGAYTRIVYARKHFSPLHRALYWGAVLPRSALRSLYGGRGEHGRAVRIARRRAVATLVGRAPLPHGPPSRFSVRIAGPEQRSRRVQARLRAMIGAAGAPEREPCTAGFTSR